MAGFWGACRRKPTRPEGQVELPQWAGFELFIGDQRERLIMKDRKQQLDLKLGEVVTKGRMKSIEIERSCWMSEANKHVGVFSATLTNTSSQSRPVKIRCREIFDASDLVCFDTQPPEIVDNIFHISGREERLGTELYLASRLDWSFKDKTRVSRKKPTMNGATVACISEVRLAAGESVTLHRYVALALDRHTEDGIAFVRSTVQQAATNPQALRSDHNAAWQQLWRSRIEVDHPRIQRILNAGLYYLYISLRPDEAWSHGPAGLTNDAWDGTVFWDTELWTLPPLALLQPQLALACARYRFNTLAGARANAQVHQEAGGRFAWQSAATGKECCVRPTFIEERHIVSCVARGQWLATIASGDATYRTGPCWNVVLACAEYWVSRIEVDEDGSAHIRQVCGPDEDAGLVDDNAMTNVSAAWTLRLADRMAKQLLHTPDPRWRQLANALVVPWDEERDIPKQMASWQDGTTIKQADATLLVHPWQFPLDEEAKSVRCSRFV
jgi:trehalose/maltose hydrolase-like predicted phosphorylase